MKTALLILFLAYAATDGAHRRRGPLRCGLPTFTSRLPKNAQEKVLKIWENYEDGDDCQKEYQETKEVLDALPPDVRSRAMRPKVPLFLKGASSEVRAQFDAVWKNQSIPYDEKPEKLKQLAEKLLNAQQLKEFKKFHAAIQRRKEEFERKLKQLTPEARAAHEKLAKLREEKRKIFMEASESVRTELNNLYHDDHRRHDQRKRETTGSRDN